MTDQGTEQDDLVTAIQRIDRDQGVVRVDATAMAALSKSEIEAQVDAAHRWPRSIGKFMKDAESMATLTPEVAQSCIYALPRGKEPSRGPSVRLAEICASAYCNLQIGSRVLDAEETEVLAQGAAWDMERNLRIVVDVRRRILDKYGKRYNSDMINVTGAAAVSIGLRNAIFRVVPRAYVDVLYSKARACAIGDARTLSDRRGANLAWLQRAGVTVDRVLARVDRRTVEDIGLDELETLIGLCSGIKNNEITIDEAFPEDAKEEQAARTKGRAERVAKARAQEPTSSTATSSPTTSPPAPTAEPSSNADSEPPSHVKTEDFKSPEIAKDGPSKLFTDYLDAVNGVVTLASLSTLVRSASSQLVGLERDQVLAAAKRREDSIRNSEKKP